MPPSQLKSLKASLREQGIFGQQKSKKEKRRSVQNGAAAGDRFQRQAALERIRDQYNPFDAKPTRGGKFDVAGSRQGKSSVTARPGVSKSLGEETRRRTLLVDIQRRKKVGGILDRRFGENDPSVTPDQRALERFVSDKQQGHRKQGVFNLEDTNDDVQLTHLGQSLGLGAETTTDDFAEELGSEEQDKSEDSLAEVNPRKRVRLSDAEPTQSENEDGESSQAEPPRSRKDIMAEVVAKSKAHKYERQKAKEDDDDLRAELDRGLGDVLQLLGGPRKKPNQVDAMAPTTKPEDSIHPDRLSLLEGKSRRMVEKEYDERLRQMTTDERSKPSVPSLTAEMKQAKELELRKEVDEQRTLRMTGEQMEDDEDAERIQFPADPSVPEELELNDTFGLGGGLANGDAMSPIQFEDEDRFMIDEDLVSNGSDLDPADLAMLSGVSDVPYTEDDDVEADEEPFSLGNGDKNIADIDFSGTTAVSSDLKRLDDFQEQMHSCRPEDLSRLIQRTRAKYDASPGNKAYLASIGAILVKHLSYLGNQSDCPSGDVLDGVIRHLHSMSKSFALEIGNAFRELLQGIATTRMNDLSYGDLIVLTAIGSIYPTSDHFHQVATPAILCMTHYLSQKIPQDLTEAVTGAYVCNLCLQYQRTSKRYVPEVINYICNTIIAIADLQASEIRRSVAYRSFPQDLKLSKPIEVTTYDFVRLNLREVSRSSTASDDLRLRLLHTDIKLIDLMGEIWNDKLAFCEIFDPVYRILRAVKPVLSSASPSLAPLTKSLDAMIRRLHIRLDTSASLRKPLRLHNHRPLPIKTFLPKFEDDFKPDKHYDPDQERAATAKLKAELKKERKGALRELRKDANFIARQQLRDKRERDEAYDRKFKHLVAEIQGEEGHEAKAYEKEKRLRKGKGRNKR